MLRNFVTTFGSDNLKANFIFHDDKTFSIVIISDVGNHVDEKRFSTTDSAMYVAKWLEARLDY